LGSSPVERGLELSSRSLSVGRPAPSDPADQSSVGSSVAGELVGLLDSSGLIDDGDGVDDGGGVDGWRNRPDRFAGLLLSLRDWLVIADLSGCVVVGLGWSLGVRRGFGRALVSGNPAGQHREFAALVGALAIPRNAALSGCRLRGVAVLAGAPHTNISALGTGIFRRHER
jgi:hypothetical protein